MRWSMFRSGLVTLLLWLPSSAVLAEARLSEETEQLHSLIKPAETEEGWSKIPWRIDLWKARQEAAASGKPILLWEMDGHPLGCT